MAAALPEQRNVSVGKEQELGKDEEDAEDSPFSL